MVNNLISENTIPLIYQEFIFRKKAEEDSSASLWNYFFLFYSPKVAPASPFCFVPLASLPAGFGRAVFLSVLFGLFPT